MWLPPSSLSSGSCSRRRLLGVSAGLLAACGAPQPPLRVGSIVFPGYEHLFLAREQGYIDSARLRLIEIPTSSFAIRALAAAQLEAAQLTLDEVVTARAAGVDLALILVLDESRGSDAIYSREPLQLNQLAGKRIGVEEGAGGVLMLEALLRAANLLPSQLLVLPSTLPRSAEVFKRGVVDLIVTAEPWASEIEAAGGHRLFDSTALPGLIVDVLAVRREVINRQPQTLQALVAGILRARAFHQAQPQQAAALMARRLGVPAAAVPSTFKGLHLPDLAENRRLLQPGGDLQRAAENLLILMRRARLLRSERVRQAVLAGLVEPRFLPALDAP